ncbi:sulfotransferase [Candidatus Falkowbacteria bacterium]|nr:sulfotransferase [Candidatus Falkowbacteria bacterium]
MNGQNNIQDPDQQKELDRWQCLDFYEQYEDTSDYVSWQPIFIIGGCGRSGTTLLRVMLDTHSLLACGPESLLFLPLPINPEGLHQKFEVPLEHIQTWQRQCRSRSKFIVQFYESYLTIRKRKIWGDKTSRNIHRFNQILRHFPNAKLIHVVRDPRDVVCSLKTHRKRKVVDGKLVPTGWKMPFDDCVVRWLRAMEDVLPVRDHPNYIEVKYEDIVSHTTETLTQVCRHIGVEFEQSMLQFHIEAGQFRNALLFPQNVEATEPISTRSVGRWKTELSNVESEEVLRRTGYYTNILGYRS